MRDTTHFLLDASLADGADPEAAAGYFENHHISSEVWPLVRSMDMREFALKADELGFIGVMEEDSIDEVRAKVSAIPSIASGLLTFRVIPLAAVAHLA